MGNLRGMIEALVVLPVLLFAGCLGDLESSSP